jgi:hypothetical protein
MLIQHTIINLDFYNESISCKINGTNHVFSSVESFVTKTNYPFASSVGLCVYEPTRNIFLIEEVGGHGKEGADLPEIVWCKDNLSVMENAAIEDRRETSPTLTARMQATELLYMTDWVSTRWQEETLLGIPHSISQEKFNEFLQYRQALRELRSDTPAMQVTWPTNPLG